MELASLVVAVDSRQARTAEDDLNKLSSAGERVERSVGGVGHAGREAGRGSEAAARGSRNAARAMDNQNRSAINLTRSIRAYAVAAVAAGTAVVAWANGVSRSMDQTLKMSQQIGITTEALTGLRYAAQQMANVNDTTLDMSLRRMTRRVAEAAAGTGAATGALQALGLSAQELTQLPVEEQFLRIADAMQQTESQGERLRHAMAVFDTEGVALVNALREGRQGIMDYVAEAERFGVVLSESAARAASEFQTQMTRLQSGLSGISMEIAERVLPTLSRAVEAVAENIDTVIRGMVVPALTLATMAVYRLNTAIRANPVGALLTGLTAVTASLIVFRDQITVTADGLITLGDVVAGVWEEMKGGISSAIEGISDFIDNLTGDIRDSDRTIGEHFLNIAETGAETFDAIVGFVSGMIGAINAGLTGLANNFINTFHNIRVSVGRSFESFINELKTRLNVVLEAVGMEPLVPQYTMWGDEREILSAREWGQRVGDAFSQGMEFSGASDALGRVVQNAQWRAYMRYYADDLFPAIGQAATKATGSSGAGGGGGVKGLASAVASLADEGLTFEKVWQQHIESLDAQIEGAYQLQFALEDQIATYGMTESQVMRLRAAEAEESVVKMQSARAAALLSGASDDLIARYDEEIAKLRDLAQVRRTVAGLQEEVERREGYERFAEEARRQNELIGQSLTDALLRGFEDGRGFAENFAKTLKDMFASLVLRPIIQPIAQGAAGVVTNALGLNQPGGIGSMIGSAQGISGMFSALSGGLVSSVGSGVAAIGNAIGSQALTSFAAGMKGSTLAAGLAGPTTAGAGGAMGLGAAVGSALPWVAGGLAAYQLISGLFNEPETRSGGSFLLREGQFVGRTGGPSGGADAAATAFAQSLLATTSDALERAFSSAGINAQLANWLVAFEDSEKGRGGTYSFGDLIINGEVIRFGAEGKGRGHGGTSGTLAEMMRNAEIDAWQTVIQGWQAAIDEFPVMLQNMIRGIDADSLDLEAAQALVQAFVIAAEQARALADALEELPFAPAAARTFEYAAALAEAAGGAENAATLLGSFYQNYYSEAERVAWLTQQLTKQFATLGFELPRTREEFRALVEANLALGEAGARTVATLLGLESALSSILPAFDTAGDAVDAFGAQLQRVRDVANEANRLLGIRTTAGTLLDRINRNTAFGDMREQELWAAMSTASYEQQIELASELTDIVLQRYETEIASVERLRDLGRGLRDYLDSLATSDLAPVDLATKVSEAERQLQEAVARARAGDEDALGQIQGLTQNALELWRRYGASGDAYQDAYYRITGMVGDLADQAMSDADRQLSVSQDTLAQLEQLRSVAETAYAAIDAQYQAIQLSLQNETHVLTELGIQSGQLNTIADLLRSMPASLAAALQPMLDAATQSVISDWYAGTGITPDQSAMDYWTGQLSSHPQSVVQDDFYKTLVDHWYKDHLGWSGDIAGIEYWAEQAKLLGPEQAFINFARTAGIPGYWMGGYASGLSLVGERGPELVDFANPGRVYSNDVLAKVMRGGSGDEPSNAEIKALLEKVLRAIEVADRNNVAGLSANVNATNQSADKIADATERGVHAAALSR